MLDGFLDGCWAFGWILDGFWMDFWGASVLLLCGHMCLIRDPISLRITKEMDMHLYRFARFANV